jgi:hypothetical protein
MKAVSGILLAASATCLSNFSSYGAPATIAIGDSQETLSAVLGRPTGSLEMGGKQLLYFDRGEVTLTNGQVVNLDLVSPEAAILERERRTENRAAAIARNRTTAEERVKKETAQRAANTEYLRREQNALIFALEDRIRRSERGARNYHYPYSLYASSYDHGHNSHQHSGYSTGHSRGSSEFNHSDDFRRGMSGPRGSGSSQQEEKLERDFNTHYLEISAQINRQVREQNRILALHNAGPHTRATLLSSPAATTRHNTRLSRTRIRATPPNSHPTFFSASLRR